MAEAMHFLSGSDVSILKQMLGWWKTQPPGRRPTGIGSEENNPRPHQAPEVYIALPPITGIPALTRGNLVVGTGTGSGTAHHVGTSPDPGELDLPGVALCTLAMIINVDSSTPQITELNEVGQVTVYNLSETALGYDWIQVHRDKFGRWLAVTSIPTTQEDRVMRGVLNGALATGSSATLDKETFNSVTGTWSRTGTTYTVYPIWYMASSIVSGTHVLAIQINSLWFVVLEPCDILGTGT